MLRTLLKRAALSLLLGLLTTIVVAWFFALRPASNNASFYRAFGFIASDLKSGYAHLLCWTETGRLKFSAEASTGYFSYRWSRGPTLINEPADAWVPPWTRPYLQIRSLEPDAPGYMPVVGHVRRELLAFGWPAICMSCQPILEFSTVRWSAADGIVLPRSGSPLDPRILPLRPIPSGFLVNTLFYAALAFPLLLTPRLARRIRSRLRANRHLCPTCRYDLRGLPPSSPCPECGTPTSK